MRRRATVAIALLVLVLTATVGAVSSSASPHRTAATKLTVWVGWSTAELAAFKKVTDEYDAKNPDVELKVVGSINDDKIIAALRSGNAPDVVSSFTSSNVGIYCSSGGWIDLGPYLKRDRISTSIFPAATMYYTQYGGTRCALPLLADAYGFYYNKALFKKAGLTGPPKTFSQLTAYAKKLTTRKSDGSLDVVGFDPVFGFYQNGIGAYQTLVGAKYFDASGKSAFSKDPAWAALLRWQKALIDFYGYSKLVKWQTGAGDEFSASHAFERGKLAMMLDGEWRVRFIGDEAPSLSYAAAPMPVADGKPSLYGSGYLNGTIIGMPKSGKNREEAWKLVRYLTTNTHALVTFSNGIRNVPSTKASAVSKQLIPDANFAVFGKVFVHPKSTTIPITAIGADHLNTFQNFIAKWQAGKVSDLHAGLVEVDKQVDAKLKQAGGAGNNVP